jgi:prepilin-type N-terminal cleavage/methylation domain-containing protein/prepilin-type processing-associated H-X9-DG protein
MANSVKKALTLVELLVVLAVIGILAALLMPVFIQVHGSTRISCMSNEKQIGTALSMYVEDYGDTYPNHRFLPLGSQVQGDLDKNSWRTVLAAYSLTPEVFACPDNPDHNTPSYDPKYPISYAANMAFNPREYPTLPPPMTALGSGLFGKELSAGVRAASIARPAECIAIVEIAHIPASAFVVDIAADSGPGVRVYADCLFTGRWGGSNYLFADSHVKFLKPTQTYSGNTVNYWYRDASPLGDEARQTLAIAERH